MYNVYCTILYHLTAAKSPVVRCRKSSIQGSHCSATDRHSISASDNYHHISFNNNLDVHPLLPLHHCSTPPSSTCLNKNQSLQTRNRHLVVLNLQILLLIVSLDGGRVSLGLSLHSPDFGYSVLSIENSTDLFQRKRSVGTLGLDDGEVQPYSLEYQPHTGCQFL